MQYLFNMFVNLFVWCMDYIIMGIVLQIIITSYVDIA